ncbi:MAG: hypothetical protein WCL71_05085 [Deltaproteobacteria bacterium]
MSPDKVQQLLGEPTEVIEDIIKIWVTETQQIGNKVLTASGPGSLDCYEWHYRYANGLLGHIHFRGQGGESPIVVSFLLGKPRK